MYFILSCMKLVFESLLSELDFRKKKWKYWKSD